MNRGYTPWCEQSTQLGSLRVGLRAYADYMRQRYEDQIAFMQAGILKGRAVAEGEVNLDTDVDIPGGSAYAIAVPVANGLGEEVRVLAAVTKDQFDAVMNGELQNVPLSLAGVGNGFDSAVVRGSAVVASFIETTRNALSQSLFADFCAQRISDASFNLSDFSAYCSANSLPDISVRDIPALQNITGVSVVQAASILFQGLAGGWKTDADEGYVYSIELKDYTAFNPLAAMGAYMSQLAEDWFGALPSVWDGLSVMCSWLSKGIANAIGWLANLVSDGLTTAYEIANESGDPIVDMPCARTRCLRGTGTFDACMSNLRGQWNRYWLSSESDAEERQRKATYGPGTDVNSYVVSNMSSLPPSTSFDPAIARTRWLFDEEWPTEARLLDLCPEGQSVTFALTSGAYLLLQVTAQEIDVMLFRSSHYATRPSYSMSIEWQDRIISDDGLSTPSNGASNYCRAICGAVSSGLAMNYTSRLTKGATDEQVTQWLLGLPPISSTQWNFPFFGYAEFHSELPAAAGTWRALNPSLPGSICDARSEIPACWFTRRSEYAPNAVRASWSLDDAQYSLLSSRAGDLSQLGAATLKPADIANVYEGFWDYVYATDGADNSIGMAFLLAWQLLTHSREGTLPTGHDLSCEGYRPVSGNAVSFSGQYYRSAWTPTVDGVSPVRSFTAYSRNYQPLALVHPQTDTEMGAEVTKLIAALLLAAAAVVTAHVSLKINKKLRRRAIRRQAEYDDAMASLRADPTNPTLQEDALKALKRKTRASKILTAVGQGDPVQACVDEIDALDAPITADQAAQEISLSFTIPGTVSNGSV